MLHCSIGTPKADGFKISQRLFLDSDGQKAIQPITDCVLNEVSLTRGSAESMVMFELFINDEYLTTV